MLRPYQIIDRRKTRVINVGNVLIGGDNPVSVQTMTNTITSDIKNTLNQINNVVEAGADLVRVSVPDKDSTDALKIICKSSKVPIIADIHFHYKRALEAADNGASCLRINPGNILVLINNNVVGRVGDVGEVVDSFVIDNNFSN